MAKITIHTDRISGANYESFRYPAGEMQVRLGPNLAASIEASSRCTVVSHIGSADDIMETILLGDALRGALTPHSPLSLVLPYFPYSRADRRFTKGDCFGVRVFASVLRGSAYGRVHTLDCHSAVAKEHMNGILEDESASGFIGAAICHVAVTSESDRVSVLFPDSGARARYAGAFHAGSNTSDIETTIFNCEKQRDPSTGVLSGFNVPENLPDAPILIVDDLCDGGGTFLGISEKLGGRLASLYVTHGVFSKGLDGLLGRFQRVYHTNSLRGHSGDPAYPKVVNYDCLGYLLRQAKIAQMGADCGDA